MSYIPEPGHRVRRTQITEGTVVEVSHGVVKFADHSMAMLDSLRGNDVREDTVTWERLPDPEPDWQPGDIALAYDGQIWRRRFPNEERFDRAPWMSGCGDWEREDYPVRPLVRLVPEKEN